MTKQEILKFKILKIETETSVGSFKSRWSVCYDKNGNDVMVIMEDSDYKYIAYNEFQDTLLLRLIEVTYKAGVLTDSLVTKFSYKFDSRGRITETISFDPDGKIRINKIIYNSAGETDTTYRYISYNKLSDSTLTECGKFVYLAGKEILYRYDSIGWNSPNQEIVESINSDTLLSSITKKCKVDADGTKNCKTFATKLFLNEGRQIKFEQEDLKILVEHSYEKNSKGFIIRHVSQSKNPSGQQIQVDQYKYWIRQ